VRHYHVTFADALSSHERALKIRRGRPGILDRNLIESAIARPYWYRSISRKAAALFESVAQNHGFVEGNKRTAVILTTAFIDLSGYELRLAHDKDLIMKAVAKAVVVHALEFEELVAWFRARLHRR
jgi:death on curing protein